MCFLFKNFFLYYYTVAFRCNSCSTRKVSMSRVCVFLFTVCSCCELKTWTICSCYRVWSIFLLWYRTFFRFLFFLLFALVHSFSTCTPLLYLSLFFGPIVFGFGSFRYAFNRMYFTNAESMKNREHIVHVSKTVRKMKMDENGFGMCVYVCISGSVSTLNRDKTKCNSHISKKAFNFRFKNLYLVSVAE